MFTSSLAPRTPEATEGSVSALIKSSSSVASSDRIKDIQCDQCK
uniref:Uncharacterized protein n=1 Tax=Arundo donax TaxID=35708 RepID=A0A0A9SYF2_ARUDO